MMKDLLVYVPPAKKAAHLLEYAISLTSKLQAHLEGVTFSFLPQLARFYTTMPDGFVARIQQQSAADADNALQNFVERAGLAKIPHAVRCVATAADDERSFGHIARCFDMAIVPQTEADETFNFEDTIFVSGRPTLFVPAIHRGPASLDRILLCWNGDRWAARAAADALPLMKLASGVDVLQIELGGNGASNAPAGEIVRHLQRHGIKSALHVFGPEDRDIGAAILSFAADCGTRLIVMGGYGHSRAREFLFGGTTREVLKSMTVPVLMSH
jgi:nucleotide-binding universal stress UspA family protein